MPNSIFLSNGLSSDAGGNATTPGTITAGGAGGSFYAADGTALLPAYSFTSEPTLGFWRSGAGNATFQGTLIVSNNFTAVGQVSGFTGLTAGNGLARFTSPAQGVMNVGNQALTIGSQFKADALPTIASGFGAGASIIAGSTPLSGSVNTGAISASGVINFNGTAFPSAPQIVAMNETTGLAVKVVKSTTQLTLSPATGNFAANDIVSWVAISSK